EFKKNIEIVIKINEIQTHGFKLASKGKRLLASFTEGVIFITLTRGIYLIFGKSFSEYWNGDFELIEIVYSAITALIVGAIFYLIFTGNLGRRIFKLKVISGDSGEDYNKAEKEHLENV